MLRKLSNIYRILVYAFPGILFFSYYPVMRLGSDETMYFELSLPLIFLVLFDLVALILMVEKKVLFRDFRKKWMFLLFPIFLTFSVLWSANSLRGFLTVGVLWLLYFAIYAMFSLKDELKGRDFKERFWKIFLGSTLVVCAWCFLQCILDLFGVPRECSLMCEGCVSASFGFPHPNGFAIEPQFMGNLLLAPAIIVMGVVLRKMFATTKDLTGFDFLSSKFLLLCLFIISATLFLTFSRGAIYAFGIAMIFMTVAYCLKHLSRAKSFRSLITTWLVVALAFVFTLNFQGVMTSLGPTNDTYFDGIAKVLNHLSLGVIDVRAEPKFEEQSEETYAPSSELTEVKNKSDEKQLVENVVENVVENSEKNEKPQSLYDGYVAESTDIRLQMNDAAIKLWTKDFGTILFGVGLGGAGQALYDNGLTDWSKEIVQNQYVSLLLETGLIGMILLILTLVLVLRAVMKSSQNGVLLSLIVAYGVSLMFFAGLPNALQVYLMPVVFYLEGNGKA